MEKVMSWRQARAEGYSPQMYSYDIKDIPQGESEAILDFKIWSKRPLTMNCYFTAVADGRRFMLSVYRSHSGNDYSPAKGGLDFHGCPAPALYRIGVVLDGKGRAVFNTAKQLLIKQKLKTRR